MKKARIVALIGACVLLLSGCSAGAGDSTGTSSSPDHSCEPILEGVETINEGKLTAFVAEYPPYVYKDGDSVSGVDGELLKRVADALCLEADIQQTSFAAIIEGIKSGRADISAGDWTLNEERQQLFEVSQPVYEDKQGVISLEGYTTVEELVGKTVGTVSGYLIVPDMQAAFGTDNVRLYQSDVEGYQDLKAGRIDAFISGQGALAFMLTQNNDTTTKNRAIEPDERIGATVNPSVAVALIAKDNIALRKAVDLVIDEYRSSGDLATQLESDGVDPTSADVG